MLVYAAVPEAAMVAKKTTVKTSPTNARGAKAKKMDCAVLKLAPSGRAWSVATTEYVLSLKDAARRLLHVTEIFQQLFAGNDHNPTKKARSETQICCVL